MRRLLWLLLAILTVVMFVLALETDDGTIAGLSRLDFSSLVVKVAVILFIGALALAFFRDRFSQALEAAAVWVVIALLLAVGYTYRFELRSVCPDCGEHSTIVRMSSTATTVCNHCGGSMLVEI